jgi:hypothetical protein
MKTPATLQGVRVRLEEAAALLPGEPGSPQELYDRLEEVAIAILDSEHTEWPTGMLEEYLMLWLRLRRMELGLESREQQAGA